MITVTVLCGITPSEQLLVTIIHTCKSSPINKLSVYSTFSISSITQTWQFRSHLISTGLLIIMCFMYIKKWPIYWPGFFKG